MQRNEASGSDGRLRQTRLLPKDTLGDELCRGAPRRPPRSKSAPYFALSLAHFDAIDHVGTYLAAKGYHVADSLLGMSSIATDSLL